MGILEDVLKALERVPGWKRISGLPSEVDELKKRIAALEERIAPASGQKCPKCGALAYRLTSSSPVDDDFADSGAMTDHYSCSSCSYTNRVFRP
ncbi:hypothetical protein [Piscinibacter defluvii]|uniref:hypothetical protein n=1 Tax=Piscinibacter defluvii TaxID=1796922 RepID=UPI000FDE1988|nr:hypothetical protein [Piscinibacter defluvii]